MSLYGPGDVSPASTPLDVAFSELAVCEEGGPNRGLRVDEYLRAIGLDPDHPKAPKGGYQWCAAGAVWCVRRVGWSVKPSARVERLWDFNEALRVESPEPGDLFIHLQPDGDGHTGFFVRAVADGFEEISGNTNLSGSRAGNRWAIKVRPWSYAKGWVRPRGSAVLRAA